MTPKPKLLISPKNLEEAKSAIKGGADIIDVKNPEVGSLGANFPWIIQEVESVLPEDLEMSAAIGDFSFMPGTASLSAYSVSALGADYVKVGLKLKSLEEARKMAGNVVDAVEMIDPEINVVLAGYADHRRLDSLGPEKLIQAAWEAGCDFCMFDTYYKDEGNLFSHLTLKKLSRLSQETHEKDMGFAVGGSVEISDISYLLNAQVDVIGVRGAVCDGSRLNCINSYKVALFSQKIDEFF